MGRKGRDLKNRIRDVRTQARLSQDELATAAGISRQAVVAIERGQYVPNTLVAMQLARALRVSVEDLFSLDPPTEEAAAVPEGATVGQRVVVGTVDGRLVAHGLAGQACLATGFAAADGYYDAATDRTTLFTSRDVLDRTAILVGCDPSLGLLAAHVNAMSAQHRLMWIPGSSGAAMEALREGRAHVAGVHLRDGQTGDFNSRASLSGVHGDVTMVSYARWDQGLVVKRGNPLRLRSADDLVRSELRFVNRDAGSGSRVLLDQALAAARLPGSEIRGYEVELDSHAAVVQHVAAGAADAGLAIEAVARAADLDFVPLAAARFDLIIPNRHLRHPAVVLMLEALQRGSLRRELQTLPGYDVSDLGGLGALN